MPLNPPQPTHRGLHSIRYAQRAADWYTDHGQGD